MTDSFERKNRPWRGLHLVTNPVMSDKSKDQPVLIPDATQRRRSPTQAISLAFQSRFVVLQAIGGAGVLGLWLTGVADKPFRGDNAILCWIIAAIGALGVLCVYLQRWTDVEWLATHVVRFGLLGTVVGLIVAFSAASAGDSTDPNEIRSRIATVIDGMYVSLYATLLGVAANLWLKVNLRLLGNSHG